MKRYTTPDVLLLDELGYLPCDARSGNLLYSIVSRRHERASTIITTNLAFKERGTVADTHNEAARQREEDPRGAPMTRPSVEQLWGAPELAVYPEIQDLDNHDDYPELRGALEIIDTARAVAACVNRYKLALLRAQQRDELLPF